MCVGCGEGRAIRSHLGPGFPGPSGQSAPPPSHVTTLPGPWELSSRRFPGPSLLGDLSPGWATGIAHPPPWRVCAHSGASGQPCCSAHLQSPPARLRAVSKGRRGDAEVGWGGEGRQPAGRQSFLLAIGGKERWCSLLPPPRLFRLSPRSPSLRYDPNGLK